MLQNQGLLIDNDVHFFMSPDLNHGFLSNIPERRLEKAILEQAIQDIIRPLENNSAGKHKLEVIQRQALAWVFGDEQNFVYSFDNICLDLKVDSTYVKNLLQYVLKSKFKKVLKIKTAFYQKNKVSYNTAMGTRNKTRTRRKAVA